MITFCAPGVPEEATRKTVIDTELFVAFEKTAR